MRRTTIILFALLVALGVGLGEPAAAQQDRAEDEDRVVSIDFVKTVPHEHDRYIQYVQTQWIQAREAARREGFVTRYEVLVRSGEGDADVDWNVMLVTEYRDDFAYDRRQELYGDLFGEAALSERTLDAMGPSDLAEVVAEHVVAEYLFMMD